MNLTQETISQVHGVVRTDYVSHILLFIPVKNVGQVSGLKESLWSQTLMTPFSWADFILLSFAVCVITSASVIGVIILSFIAAIHHVLLFLSFQMLYVAHTVAADVFCCASSLFWTWIFPCYYGCCYCYCVTITACAVVLGLYSGVAECAPLPLALTAGLFLIDRPYWLTHTEIKPPTGCKCRIWDIQRFTDACRAEWNDSSDSIWTHRL